MSTTYSAELSSLSDSSSGIESLTDSVSGWSIDFKKTVWPRSDVKIVDKIGEGFFADVFLVREKKSGGKVVYFYLLWNFEISSTNFRAQFGANYYTK